MRAVGAPLRIFPFGARADLRDAYARLRARQNSIEVTVPSIISDPGPVTEQDFDHLQANQETSFERRGTPLVLTGLKPGEYSVDLTVQTDIDAVTIKSNLASFRVIPYRPLPLARSGHLHMPNDLRISGCSKKYDWHRTAPTAV